MQVVIDHLAGSRRGERQVLSAVDRIGLGRHPACAVAFDANRDLDASARHAELRPTDVGGWVLVDLGSANGTFVDGLRVSEVAIAPEVACLVQLGPAGPRVRILLTSAERAAALPALSLAPPPRPRWVWPVVAAIGAAGVAAAVWWAFG